MDTDGQHIYTVTDTVPGRRGYSKGACDSMGTGKKCGATRWQVPDFVEPGIYQVVVISNQNQSMIRYTDDFVITA